MTTISILGFTGRLVYRNHALHRMQERRISERELRAALSSATKIEDYPDLTPFPGMLILGHAGKRPIHLVVSFDSKGKVIYVITVYEPDPLLWESGFTRRHQ